MPKRKEIDVDLLSDMLENHMSIVDIAKYFECSKDVITDRMRQHGLKSKYIPKNKGVFKKFPHIDKEWLVDNWLNTQYSLKTLSLREGCNIQLLEGRAKKFGLKKPYKYFCNMELITDLSNPNVYYLAGLIATDGWIEPNHHAINIGFVNGDSEIRLLESIREIFGIENPIYYHSNSVTLSIRQFGIRDLFINNFNIPSGGDKGYKVGVPNYFYNDDCKFNYIRGLLDGDGTISKKGSISILKPSDDLIYGLQNIIQDHFGFSGSVYRHTYSKKYPNYKFPCLSICKTNGIKILESVYSGTMDLYLDRKYSIYLNILNHNNENKESSKYPIKGSWKGNS